MARSLSDRRKRRAAKARKRAETAGARKARRRVAAKVALCVLVAVLLGVLPVFLNDPIGYVPIVAYLLLLAFCAVYINVCRRCLVFEDLSTVGSVVRGQEARFAIKLRNKGPLPLVHVAPSLVVRNDAGGNETTERFVVALGPFETYDVEFDTRFMHIGTYMVGIPTVQLADMLGLFTATRQTGALCHVEVLPRVFDVTALAFDHELLKEVPEARSPMALDGSDYTGVRDYANGDPMKSIHWKLSARGTIYYTKLFETLGKPGIEAVLDFHSPAYEAEDLLYITDAIVESGLSIGAYARKNSMDFDLVFRNKAGRDERIGGLASGRSRAKFLQAIPPLSTDERDLAALDLYRRETTTRLGQPNMVMVTACFDEPVLTALLMAKRHRRNPSLIAIVPPSLSEAEVAERTRILRRLDSAKVSYLVISAADEVGGGRA